MLDYEIGSLWGMPKETKRRGTVDNDAMRAFLGMKLACVRTEEVGEKRKTGKKTRSLDEVQQKIKRCGIGKKIKIMVRENGHWSLKLSSERQNPSGGHRSAFLK